MAAASDKPKPAATPAAKAPRVKVGVGQPAGAFDASDESERKNLSTVRKSLVFLGFVAVAYVLYLVLSGQVGTFFSALNNVAVGWVIAAMLAYVVYYLLGVGAYAMAVANDPASPLGVRDLMSVEAAGIFFSNLTPNGTGGAPAQIFRLTRAGLSMGQAGALQYTRFIIYEAAEGIFAAIMLIFRLDYFTSTYGDVFLVGAILFGCKIASVAGLLLVCLFPRPTMALGNALIGFLERRRWLRRPEHWREVVNTQLLDFSRGFRAAAANVRGMLATLALTLVQLGCLYALPWFVLRSFHIEADLLTCLACGSMLELLTSAIPLPGGTGGAEGGFAFLFGPMFGDAIAAGFVVWRMVEYFLPVLAAVPLLGLRSNGRDNVYEKSQRLSSLLARLRARLLGEGEGTAVRSSSRPAAPSHGSGVTVSPKSLKARGGARASTKGRDREWTSSD